MAIIYDPKLTLSLTDAFVTVDVTYDLRFQGYEQQPWLTFIEKIDVLGGKPVPTLTANLTFTAEQIHRHLHADIPRHYFDGGTLPLQIWCRIRVESSPLIGAEAQTNSRSVPSLAVRPFLPLKRLQRAAIVAIVAAAGVAGLVAVAHRR